MNTEAECAEQASAERRLFAYEPKAPRVPTLAGCDYQRWFDGDQLGSVEWGVTVLRDASANVCALSLYVNSAGVTVNAGLKLAPEQLRGLAARLLRAADDIEAFPASEGGAA